MSFKSRFLKSNSPGVVNTVVLRELGTNNSFIFHPFIESFDRTVEPNIKEEKYGLFGAVSNHRTGFAVERYSMTLVLPAVDGPQARSNYLKIDRLIRVVNPTRRDILSSDALFSLKMTPLIGKTLKGHITAVSEQHDLDTGFIDGYPKVMRVTLTFTVDKLLEELNRAPGLPTEPTAVNTTVDTLSAATSFVDNITGAKTTKDLEQTGKLLAPAENVIQTLIKDKKSNAKALPGAKKK